MHSCRNDYRLLPTSKINHFIETTSNFLSTYFTLFFIGMQHDVIHPPDPFGLPLEYSLLPQELKKVGKCENYQQTGLASWLSFKGLP